MFIARFMPGSVDWPDEREDVSCADYIGDDKHDKDNQQYPENTFTAGIQLVDSPVDARKFAVTQAVDASGYFLGADTEFQ